MTIKQVVFLFHFADDLVILSSCSAVCSCWVNAASFLEFSGNSIITAHKTMYWKTYSCDYIFTSEYGFAVKYKPRKSLLAGLCQRLRKSFRYYPHIRDWEMTNLNWWMLLTHRSMPEREHEPVWPSVREEMRRRLCWNNYIRGWN